MIGKTVSHYKILMKLGEGGMGEVYLAEDLKLERKVAIKFLPQHLTKDKENVERFEREAKAAASLNHPNIVTIYEIAEEGDQIFIVMEYVEGKSLRDVINEYKMGFDKIIDIITQVSQGLSQAQQAGIVHRDIKPENIFIDKDARVKILDFGLAKLKGVSKLTKDSSTVGTIHYMSPEQLRGEEVDQRSDIWSLGVVFYELLTGDVPFKGDYDQAVAYSIQSEAFDPIEDMAPEHNEMLNKLLAKEPENRYKSLEEIIDALGERKGSKDRRKASKRYRYFIYPISIIILLVVGYFLITQVDFNVSKESQTDWGNSIAVLPLKDLSPEGDQEWFCEGMAEQIRSNLKMLPNLKVISRTSVMKYKNSDLSIPEIGKELNVENVLEGSVGKIGGHVRVTVQLINASDDSLVWSNKYDKEYIKLFALQDEISESIAKNLIRKISGKELERVKQNKPENLEAWEYYSRGKHMSGKFGPTGILDYFNKSEELLKKAIELDPDYAPSYAELADLYNKYFFLIASTEEEKQKYMNLQEKYINAGFKIDPQSADIYRVNGWFLVAKNDIRGAYESYKKGVILEPHDENGNYAMGKFYGSRGLNHASLKFLSRAIEINPLYAKAYYDRSAIYDVLGNLKQAESDIIKALEIDPNFGGALYLHAFYLIITERFDEAEEILNKIEELSPNNEMNKIFESMMYAKKGDKEKAFEIFPEGNWRIFLGLQMVDEMIDFYKKGIERNKNSEYSNYLYLITDRFDFLRSDPRFQEILKEEKKLYDKLLEKYPDIDM